MKALEIKKRRKDAGLTQEKLAEMLGVERRTVINYENGGVIPQGKSVLLDKIFTEIENDELITIESLVKAIVDKKMEILKRELVTFTYNSIKKAKEEVNTPINERLDYLALGMKSILTSQAKRNDKNDKQFEELRKMRKIN